jgi:hypothetical protein
MKTLSMHIAMKRINAIALAAALWLPAQGVKAQEEWPLVLNGPNARITIYQPQPISYNENVVHLMAAVSMLEKGTDSPVFGSIWANAITEPGRDSRTLRIAGFRVTESRFPDISDEDQIRRLEHHLSTELSRWDLQLSLDQLQAELDMSRTERALAAQINVNPPSILYRDEYSILVMIDGEPKLKREPDYEVQRVVNTPFTIVKNTDGQFYLYGGGYWYRAGSIGGPWTAVQYLPANLERIDRNVRDKEQDFAHSERPPAVVMTFEPAELIQTDGEALFAPLEGTGLLYVTNSDDDIFIEVASQQYYVLLSGRWYRAASLYGPWSFVPADRLPADFAGIREGSAKEMVLASVAGTHQAHEALLDAQVPQTARVDRHSANAQVDYDGDPQFQYIDGTDLSYAVNTALPVLRHRNRYYLVENGVWFVANSPYGPWAVATRRPPTVAYIPPSIPVYNVKYVYIYDVTPEYVYMGYLPGYLGAYVYGPTIVYGTGYHYRPWFGRVYYARPVTWGFAMQYNPWSGWSMGITYSVGWFHFNTWNAGWYDGWCGGWWGPVVYRPPYRIHHHHHYHHSYWGDRTVIVHNKVEVNNYYTNVYRSRRDVVTRDIARPVSAERRDVRTGTAVSRTNYSRPGTVNSPERTSSSGYRTSSDARGLSRSGSNNAPSGSSGQRIGSRPNTQVAAERQVSQARTTSERYTAGRPSAVTGNAYDRSRQTAAQPHTGVKETFRSTDANRNSGSDYRYSRSAEESRMPTSTQRSNPAPAPGAAERSLVNGRTGSTGNTGTSNGSNENRYRRESSTPAYQSDRNKVMGGSNYSTAPAGRSSSTVNSGKTAPREQPAYSRPAPSGASGRPSQPTPSRTYSSSPSPKASAPAVNRSSGNSQPATRPAAPSGGESNSRSSGNSRPGSSRGN